MDFIIVCRLTEFILKSPKNKIFENEMGNNGIKPYLTRLKMLFIPMLPLKSDSTEMLRMLSNANAESCYR